jgi:hypothetical protein
MHWTDKANLVFEFHSNKIAKFGKFVNNGKGKKIGWSIRDTARELSMSPTTVSRMVKLIQASKIYPVLLTYGELGDAEQALKTFLELEQNAQKHRLARAIGKD